MEKETLRFIRNEKLQLKGKVEKAAGIFGFPQATVTTVGLRWNLNNTRVMMGEMHSSSNYLARELVTFEVQGDAILSFPEALE